jgi:spermidine synthase
VQVRTFEAAGEQVTLREHQGRIDVILNGVVLLSSGALGTELTFGALAQGARRVLVGGLGFGATLRGVLADPGAEQVTVAEKSPAILALARGELAHLQQGALADPRVQLFEGDVLDAYPRGFDAILLDVDNGPGWASHRSNARLYAPAGLDAARRSLAPGGLLAVWSGYPEDSFVARLRAAGFQPSIVPLREGGQVRARAYLGRVPR